METGLGVGFDRKRNKRPYLLGKPIEWKHGIRPGATS